MTDKVRQHFVPRFYLKNFSLGNSGKHIGLYNFENDVQVSKASLKSQAYRKNFYGKNGLLEGALSQFETLTSSTLRRIIDSELLPPHGTDEYEKVLAFALIQHGRTLASMNVYEEMSRKSFAIAYGEERAEEMLDSMNPPDSGASVAYLVFLMAASLPLMSDLRCKLLINSSDTTLITSDNPVVKYNQFLEQKGAIGGITGLGAKGLQIFLPLSPNLALYFFDPQVYAVGKKSDHKVRIPNRDVDSLNLLQSLNCMENIYYSTPPSQKELSAMCRGRLKHKGKSLADVKEYFGEDYERKRNSLIVAHVVDLRCNLSLSFSRTLRNARKYELRTRAVHIRNKVLMDEFEQVMGMRRPLPDNPLGDCYYRKQQNH